jgi:hypothetical protein
MRQTSRTAVGEERDGIHTGMPLRQGWLNFVAVDPPRHGQQAITCSLVDPQHCQMRKPARDAIEHEFGAWKPIGDASEKLMHSLRRKVHQQALSDDENAGRGFYRIHPNRVERTRCDQTETGSWYQKALSQTDCVG